MRPDDVKTRKIVREKKEKPSIPWEKLVELGLKRINKLATLDADTAGAINPIQDLNDSRLLKLCDGSPLNK